MWLVHLEDGSGDCDNGKNQDKWLASMAVGGVCCATPCAVKPLVALVNKRNVKGKWIGVAGGW